MHVQNPYRNTKPDFFTLRDKYPEFRDVTRIINETETETAATEGHADSYRTVNRRVPRQKARVELNFKDPQAVAVLTRVLLLENFQLNVDIPPDSLVPALPLRLNYLCWVKEMLDKFALNYSNCPSTASCNASTDQILGIDIGCGPTCIYAILGRKLFGWRFVASEVQRDYATVAQENLRKNELSDCISVYAVEPGSFLSDLVRTHDSRLESHHGVRQRFHFTVCNPPFFECEQDSYEPHTCHEGSTPTTTQVESRSDGERIAKQCTGGEVQFVKRLIDDSLALRTRVLVYSTMLGRKCSVKPLQQYLLANGVRHHSAYELCQGSKMRYVLAWTFVCDESPEFAQTLVATSGAPLAMSSHWPMTSPFDWPISEFRRHKLACRREKPIEWRLPSDQFANSSADGILQNVKHHFAQLQIEILREKRRTTSRKSNEKLNQVLVAPELGSACLDTNTVASAALSEHLSFEYELKFRAFEPSWQNQRRKRRMLQGKTKASEHEPAPFTPASVAADNRTDERSAVLQARCIIMGPAVAASTSTSTLVDQSGFLMQFYLLDTKNKDYLFQLVQYLKNNLQAESH